MNIHQRGVYQPAMDNIPIYDLSDEEIEEEEHSRLPLLIVIALLVLAAFAGVVWLAYNQGVSRGRAGAAIVIAAPNGPVRTAPVDGGGTPTPFTGLKVYGQPLPPDQEAQTSSLANVPAIEIPAPAQGAAQSSTPPSRSEAPAIRLNPESPAAAVPQAPPPAPAKQTVQTTVTAAPPPPPPPAPASAAPAASAVASAALSGKAVLQIGAYESSEIANGAWTAFKTRYADVVATLAEDVQKADLGAKGTWYRLRVGPFADKAAAAAACEQLKAKGGTCFVAAP